MFDLFKIKRRKIKDWEKAFLKSALELCGKDIEQYIPQLESSLIKGVNIGVSDIPNYIGISYNSAFYKEYENAHGKSFKISNIKVKDLLSGQNLNIDIYFAYGIILGYAMDKKISKYKFDIKGIDISAIKKIYVGENHPEILSLLTQQERNNINESDIYITTLNGKDYYHLKELEDGDFVGMDVDNNIYLITHHPFEIKNMKRDRLIDFLIK